MDHLKANANKYVASLQNIASSQLRLQPVLHAVYTSIRDSSYGSLLVVLLKGFFALILVRFVIFSIYRLYFHPLRHFPGPFLAKITNLYSVYYDWWLGGQLTHHVRTVLHPKYGPIVRTRPHMLRFSEPEVFYQIHSVGYTFVRDPHTSIVWNMPRSSFSTDHRFHRERKSKIAPLFNKSKIASIEPLVHEKTKLLIEKIALRIEKRGIEGENGKALWLDVHKATLAYVLDIVQEFLSEGVGAYRLLENDESPDFHGPISDMLIFSLKLSHWHRHFPNAAVFMQKNTPNWLLEYMAPFLKNRNDIRARIAEGIYSYIPRLSTEDLKVKPKGAKLDSNGKNDKLVGYKELAPHFKEIPEDLITEAQLLIAAGSNTTAYVLAFMLYQLAVDQELQEKVVEEIERVKADGPREFSSWKALEESELLTAVVKESLRITDPIPEALARQTTKPVTLSGANIPAGTAVEMAASQVLQNPAIFGPNPEKFDHTRFLRSSGVSSEAIKQRLRYTNTVFAGGAYICTGMHMAYMELYIGLAGLVKAYKWELSEELRKDGAWLWQDCFVASKIGAEPVLGVRRR